MNTTTLDVPHEEEALRFHMDITAIYRASAWVVLLLCVCFMHPQICRKLRALTKAAKKCNTWLKSMTSPGLKSKPQTVTDEKPDPSAQQAPGCNPWKTGYISLDSCLAGQE